jgi:hypothetical protein
MKFKYFRSVKGHVVHRYGTDTLIGVTRGKEGHKWNTEKIVANKEQEAEANKSKGKEKPKKGGAGRSPKKANKGG